MALASCFDNVSINVMSSLSKRRSGSFVSTENTPMILSRENNGVTSTLWMLRCFITAWMGARIGSVCASETSTVFPDLIDLFVAGLVAIGMVLPTRLGTLGSA